MKGFAVKLDGVDSDIEIFLTNEEIINLGNKSLTGILYDPENMRIEYKAELFLDKKKMQEDSNSTIYVKKAYEVYISLNYYERLKKYGCIGTRVMCSIGDLKVDILEENTAANDEDFASSIRRINYFEKEIKKID
jgi:hypothetical protein